jgi:hypothetical protein
MVIGQPRDPAFPVALFWFEARCDTVKWWVPWPLSVWARRWSRISPKKKMHLRDPKMAGVVVGFKSEADMYRMLDQLERAEQGV